MKLAFVFNTSVTEFDGHYYSVNLTPQLWRTRYLSVFDDIVVVTRCKHSEEEPNGKLVLTDMEHVVFKPISNRSAIKRIIHLAEEEKYIEKIIADCDFVILRSWWGYQACKKLNKKYMFEVITDAWDVMWNHSALGKLVAVPYYFRQRRAIMNAPFAVYVTEKTLQKRYPTKGISIGISDVYLETDFCDETLKRRLNRIEKAENGQFVIGTAAAVDVKFKGQRFVIQAIANLRKLGINNIVYQLAGGGNPYELQKVADKYGVADSIQFVGAIPHEKMSEWYDSIDLYVQPSLQEGLPRAVVEAMSRAVPCLGTSTGGIPELIPPEYIIDRHSDKKRLSSTYSSGRARFDASITTRPKYC